LRISRYKSRAIIAYRRRRCQGRLDTSIYYGVPDYADELKVAEDCPTSKVSY
jgi:hypothetical protein